MEDLIIKGSPPAVGLCLPMGDMVHGGFAQDLALAVGYHAYNGGGPISVHTRYGTILPEQRQELAKIALQEGAEYVVMIDSDMRFPKDLIERLVAHDKPFVAVNCSKRRRPIGPTALKEVDGELVHIQPDPDKHGLEEVRVVGFGIVCIRADVFKALEYPWFMMPWVHQRQKFVGEDVFFCSRMHRAGIPMYIDHDLSWGVRHVGTYPYGMDDVLAENALAERGEWDGD